MASRITDVYLLALAVAHRGCLVTLDHGVAAMTVPQATERHQEHRQHAARSPIRVEALIQALNETKARDES